MDTKRQVFLETLYGFVHLYINEQSEGKAKNLYETIERYVKWSEANGMAPNVQDAIDYKRDKNFETVLTYKEAVAVHAALEHAHRTEAHRISYVASLEDASLTPTKLFDRLATAKGIMDVKREYAEEMGG